MRRLILRVVVMMLTFAAGAGLQHLINTGTSKPVVITETAPLTTVVEPRTVETPPPPPVPVQQTELANVVADYDFDKFFPEGSYHLMDNPKGFRDFNSFTWSLGAINKDGAKGFLEIRTDVENEYDYDAANFGLVTDQRVFFVVSKTSESGIGYRFDGKFLYRNLEPFNLVKKPVLTGTLTKTKFGKKVAEKLVNFRIEFDGC